MSAWIASLFGNPWMLLWLPTVAAPLIIHLWNRRKYREVPWAAMEYLLAAIVKSSRRMRIEQLLLLLVRVLVILLVVLALAEPFLRSVSPLSLGEGRTHRVIVIDGSYSMGYRPTGQSAFEVAKQRIAELVQNGQPGDGYSLILMGDRPEAIVGQATFDRQQFLSELEKLELREGGADLDALLRAVEEVIENSRPAEQSWRHQVTIFSDLARNTWSQEGKSEPLLRERRERLGRLAAGGTIEVVPLNSPRHDNLAVTDLKVADALATVAQPVTLTASLHNFSNQTIREQPIELWVDGHRSEQLFLDIPAGEDLQVSFQYRFQLPGEHVVSVRAEGDSLAIDNRRYLALPVKEHLNALLVQGKGGVALPFEAALDGGDFSRGLSGPIRPEVVAESALLERDLDDYDCIFLCNVGQLTGPEARRLASYLREGGGLVTILGDQVIAERYNRELFDPRQPSPDQSAQPGEQRILPARLEETVFDGQHHFFDPRDYAHPMLAKWKGNSRTGLLTVPVLKYFRLQLSEDSEAEVVLGLDTGDPLLVLEQIGRGRSLLLATDPTGTSNIDSSMRRPWSLIVSWLNSQPFFEGFWKAVIGGQIEQRNVLVGEIIVGRTAPARAASPLEVRTPKSDSRTVGNPNSSDSEWSFTETTDSGFYQVGPKTEGHPQAAAESVSEGGTNESFDRNADTVVFAVNLDTRESNLRQLATEDLPSEWNLAAWQQFPNSSQQVALSATRPLHELLLWSVLALLFSETFLAWWIGNRFA